MRANDIDLNRIVEVFNSEGKKAAAEFTEKEYSRKYSVIQKRIKEETNYNYNRNTRKYELKKEEVNAEFMTLEELCEEKPERIKTIEDRSNFDLNPHIENSMFKDIIINLMKDKMQEMSKYIHLEQSTRLVLISIKKLEANGYKVIFD